jgi:hypothetical protein
LVYIRVNWTDARQVLDPIKAAPEAALQKLRGLWLIQPRGLTYNFYKRRSDPAFANHLTVLANAMSGPAEQKIFSGSRE